MELTTIVSGAWSAFATKITVFLPMLIGAIIIFVVGLLIAKLIKMMVVRLLRLGRFDSAVEKTRVKRFLERGNSTKTSSKIVLGLIHWFVMTLAIIAPLNAMGLPIVSDILNDIFLSISNVVAAIVVLVLGFSLGSLLSAVCPERRLKRRIGRI